MLRLELRLDNHCGKRRCQAFKQEGSSHYGGIEITKKDTNLGIPSVTLCFVFLSEYQQPSGSTIGSAREVRVIKEI